MTNLKILIVDDEKYVSLLIEKCVDWAKYGYDIVGRAETSADAMRLFQKMWPDIVFCDINMPDIDGLSITRQMKKLNPAVHVVLVTGYRRFSYAREAIEIGVDGYVLKPVQGKELLAEADKIRERIYQTEPERLHVPMRELTQNAKVYVREHIHMPDLSLHRIADALHVSDSYLSRVFKEDISVMYIYPSLSESEPCVQGGHGQGNHLVYPECAHGASEISAGYDLSFPDRDRRAGGHTGHALSRPLLQKAVRVHHFRVLQKQPLICHRWTAAGPPADGKETK
jgi:two-component system response regulator YesN